MVKKVVFISLALAAAGYLFGCGKKQAAMEEGQEPLTMEAMSSLSTSASAPVTDVRVIEPQATLAPQGNIKLEPLPPSGPYKPTNQEIQTALANAGYYKGNIDGKIGPRTKQAIKDFQQANGLKADGKVGPMTWEALSKHAAANAAAGVPSKKKR